MFVELYITIAIIAPTLLSLFVINQRKGYYGVEGKRKIFKNAASSLILLAISVCVWRLESHPYFSQQIYRMIIIRLTLITFSLLYYIVFSFFVLRSCIGRLHVFQHMMDMVHLKGDERILNVGCDSGLLLIEAANKMSNTQRPTGKVVGVDDWIEWKREDTMENIYSEEINLHFVDLQKGDPDNLPFDDETFDIVISSFVHKPEYTIIRCKVLNEMMRVLKPGGKLILLDESKTVDKSILHKNGSYISSIRVPYWYFGTRIFLIEKGLNE